MNCITNGTSQHDQQPENESFMKQLFRKVFHPAFRKESFRKILSDRQTKFLDLFSPEMNQIL